MVAEHCFCYDGGKTKDISEEDMGLWGYLKFQIYDWLHMIGINLKWESMRKLYRVKEEAV